MQILHWKIDPQLKEEAESNYRTKYANSIKDKDPLTIIRDLTFDGVLPNIELKDIQNLLTFIQDKIIKKKYSGVGVEVGAGPLVFSSVLANYPNVTKMYGVELCESIINNLAEKIVAYIAPTNSHKIIGVAGSFDDIELPSESVDFIFDFYSLHHSPNLAHTMKELYSLLKPGGYILCLDKARPNSHTSEDLITLAEKEYEKSYKEQFNLPVELKLTRRMNGETEHRLVDWERYCEEAGFKKTAYYYLEKNKGRGMGQIAKQVVSALPISIQKNISSLLPQPRRNHLFTLESKNRIFTKYMNPFRKETSLIIAYK